MAELIETVDLTTPGEDGWTVEYRIRRDDGEEVTVQATCSNTAEVVAHTHRDEGAISAMEDRCVALALESAELAQSPRRRGRVAIRLWFDSLEGSFRRAFIYERAL